MKHSYQGKMEIERGYTPRKKAGAAGDVEKPKADPALHGFGHGGHLMLTHVATDATRVALMENPEAAYDGLLTHLAWVTLRTSSAYDAERSSASALTFVTRSHTPQSSVLGVTDLAVALDRWKERLDGKREAFCDQVAALSADDKAALLACCFAASLEAREGRFDGYDHKPERWAHLGWLARRAGVSFLGAWAADEEFLKKGSKPALALVGAELELWKADSKFATEGKKSEMVKLIAKAAGAWVPKLLRDLVAAPPAAEKPAKAPAKPKGRAADPPAGDDPELSAAVVAIATGKAKPIPEPETAD